MNLQISSDNMQVTESMKTLVENKIKKLDRLWSEINSDNIRLRVVLNSAPENTFLVKLDLNLNGETYYTEEPGFELETALIEAVEELKVQYKKNKQRYEEAWPAQREQKVLDEDELEQMLDSEEDEENLDAYDDFEEVEEEK